MSAPSEEANANTSGNVSQSPELDLIERALRSTQAGVWDKYYGEGVTVEYARAVDADLRSALDAIPALRERVAKLERTRTELLEALRDLLAEACVHAWPKANAAIANATTEGR